MIFNIDLQNNMGYTKTETLTDDTKMLYGLDTSVVPDDVFSILDFFVLAIIPPPNYNIFLYYLYI